MQIINNTLYYTIHCAALVCAREVSIRSGELLAKTGNCHRCASRKVSNHPTPLSLLVVFASSVDSMQLLTESKNI
jgi:hypothetical protein